LTPLPPLSSPFARERSARRQFEAETLAREHRAQAEDISAWLSGPDLEWSQPIALYNASVEPVYRAVVWMVFIQGAGPPSTRAGTASED
jgi:hypothetical protein